jgi:predicted DNA-binding mobile mystery protein A
MHMNMSKYRLMIEQLDAKLKKFDSIGSMDVPARGWIHAIRTSIRMSMRQLGKRLSITAQSVNDLERAEAGGTITIKSLRQAGKAMGLTLVYGFVSKDRSIEAMIEKRALEVARDIVMRTSQSMTLEDQENTPERIDKAIRERANDLKRELPKLLWE